MRTAHCDTCRMMQEEVTQRKLEVMLGRLALAQAPIEHQYQAVKQLNEAHLRLRAAEDLLEDHKDQHPEITMSTDGNEAAPE